MKRDFQRSKVYKWETVVIHQNDHTHLSEKDAKEFIDFIWYNEGRDNPPKLAIDKRMNGGSANRFEIKLGPKAVKMGLIIHEITHSLLHEVGGRIDYSEDFCHLHDEVFVGRYMDLLEKYMKFPKPMLWYTAKEHGVKYE